MQIRHGIGGLLASKMHILLGGTCGHFNYCQNSVSAMCFLQQSKYKNLKQSSKKGTGKSVKPNNKAEENVLAVYMRTTLNSISKILRFSTWESSQDQLEKLSIRWDSYTINQVLKSHPPMEKAWLFFNWASHLKGFKHDQFTYTTMLDIFGEAGRILSMKYLFEQMQEKGIKIDVVTYTSILHWLSKYGDVDGALNMWKEMSDKGCRPTVVSYTAFMKVLFDSQRPKEAAAVYREMLEAGCSPNCYTYTILIEYLAGAGKFKAALKIMNNMQAAGIQPDKATCNVFVHKCSIAGETSVMSQILLYMKENSLVLRRPIYFEALEALRTAGKTNDLLREVNLHLSSVALVEPSTVEPPISYSQFHTDQTIMLILLTRKNFIAAEILLGGMIQKKIQLDSRLIGTIIKANCANSKPSGALMAFNSSVDLGLKLKRSVYLSLLGFFSRINLFKEVVEIVEEMAKAGFSLGTNLASVLIYRLSCVGMLASSEKIFNLLPGDQNTATYTALMIAYIKCGDVDRGLDVYATMRRQGIAASQSTLGVLQKGLEEAGRSHEAEIYRKQRKSFLRNARFRQDVISAEETLCDRLFGGALEEKR